MIKFLREGGNVFPGTVDIKRDEAQYLKSLIKKILPNFDLQFDIGSVGYKDASGDMDVFVDEQQVLDAFDAPDAKLGKQALAQHIKQLGYEVAVKGRNVHVKLYDSEENPVQIDLMVIPDSSNVAPWHQHGPRGSYADKGFKGASIFILMNSIGKALGVKFDAFSGRLLDRETNEVVATGRDNVAKILLNPQATGEDLNTVQTIMNALANDPKKDAKLAQAREDAAKGLVVLPESKQQDKWFRDILSRPVMESVRIEHPEDYLLDGSKKAAEAAVEGMIALAKQLATAPKGDSDYIANATIKWDGSPALIFGHDKDGQFVLTDKSGFDAKGYDGRAKSPADIETMFMMRSKGDVDAYKAKYADLAGMYAAVWPYLKQIAPKKGFLKGDLLYATKAHNFVETPQYVKFRPNQVTYTIASDKDDYKRVKASKMGIAIHGFIPVDGTGEDVQPYDPDDLKLPDNSPVFVPHNKIAHKQSLDVDSLKEVNNALALAKSAVVSAKVNNLAAKAQGLADLHMLLRTFANKQVDAGNLNLSTMQFLAYVENSRVTPSKLANLTAFVEQHRAEFDSAFKAFGAVINAKHKLLTALNEPSMRRVEASIPHVEGHMIRGHEGLVVALDVGGYKLVDRLGFTRSLRAAFSQPKQALA